MAYPYRQGTSRQRLHLAWPRRLMVAPASRKHSPMGERGSMKHTELLFMVAMVAVAVYAIAQIFS